MKQKLMIHTSCEVFNLSPEKMVYFIANGNYTNVHLEDGTEFLITSQLGQLEHTISEQLSYTQHSFVRVGKSLIINTDRILHINVQKQTIMMESGQNDKVLLTASREALKKLMNLLIDHSQKAMIRHVGINAPCGIKRSGKTMLRRDDSRDTMSDKDVYIITMWMQQWNI